MAEESRKKRYFWLQLKEDFFEDDTIQWLEEQKPNGPKYTLFYLKLCLKSLRTDGMLYRTVGEYLMPYSVEKLAEITRTDADTVRTSLALLEKVGMVKRLDNETLYMTQIKELVGNETLGARQRREQRARKNGVSKLKCDNVATLSHSCPRNVAQSIEFRDKSLENRDNTTTTETEKKEKIGSSSNVSVLEPLDQKCQDPETSKPNAFLYLQTKRIPLSGISQPIFLDYINALGNEVVIHAIDYMLDHGSKAFTYLQQILESYYKSGVKTVDDAIKKEEAYKQKKAAKRYSKPVIQKETVPDWSQKAEPQVSDEERAKIKANLSKFKKKH